MVTSRLRHGEVITSARDGLLALSRRDQVRDFIESAPGSREILARYIVGDQIEGALECARDLHETGRSVSLSFLAGTADEGPTAAQTIDTHLDLIAAAQANGLTDNQDFGLSVRARGLGDLDTAGGRADARSGLVQIATAARAAGVGVTLDMEGPDAVDATLALYRSLRDEGWDVGVAVQAMLRRSHDDLPDLLARGARIRLCKGAFQAARAERFTTRHEVDRSFVRLLRALMDSDAYPMVATHDGRLTEITRALATRSGRTSADFEYQMYLGMRPLEQTVIADRGDRMRVYVPFGPQWYSFLMARVAEKPTNVGVFARSLLSRR